MKTGYQQCSFADCLLPWTERFELDEPVSEAHIQSVLDNGYGNLCLLGTAGEGYALSRSVSAGLSRSLPTRPCSRAWVPNSRSFQR